jgi:hypothetical protein
MILPGKCVAARTPRPPLIQGLIGRIGPEDEGIFAPPKGAPASSPFRRRTAEAGRRGQASKPRPLDWAELLRTFGAEIFHRPEKTAEAGEKPGLIRPTAIPESDRSALKGRPHEFQVTGALAG